MAVIVSDTTPLHLRSWLEAIPSWLEVTDAETPRDPALSHLDEGEAQAIGLAMERRADLLLIDERDGAIAARALGLTVTGTLVRRSGPRGFPRTRGPTYDVRSITPHNLPFTRPSDGSHVGRGRDPQGRPADRRIIHPWDPIASTPEET
jgi:hypothetical protein